jgi:putative transposase
VVFNDVINARRTAYVSGASYPTQGELGKALTAVKKTDARQWLNEVSAVVLQQAQADANTAYKNYFNSLSGKRKGRKVGPPKFRAKRDNRSSARFTSNARFTVAQVSKTGALLTLPKMEPMRMKYSRALPSIPSSVTITKTPSGQYFASFVVKREQELLPPSSRVAGIDWGLADLASIVYSDGTREKITAPQHYRKAEKRLAKLQRAYAMQKARADRARKRLKAAGAPATPRPTDVDGRPVRAQPSRIQEAGRVKAAAAHRHVANVRRNHHNKLAHRIVHENQVICLENLSITGLARTRLAKSIHDAGWGMLGRLIEEKALHHGRTVIRIDRFAPTSQTCAVCDTRGGPKPLDVREWDCGQCGARLDRDYNAAVNIIVAAGQAESLNDCGESIRLRLAEAILQEAVTEHLSNAAEAA